MADISPLDALYGDIASPNPMLSDRQYQAALMWADGKSLTDTAEALSVEPATIARWRSLQPVRDVFLAACRDNLLALVPMATQALAAQASLPPDAPATAWIVQGAAREIINRANAMTAGDGAQVTVTVTGNLGAPGMPPVGDAVSAPGAMQAVGDVS